MADETKQVNLFNPHDGLTGRDGGPYLDLVEREKAETLRAKVEGREPDYENAPAVAGTPLVTAGQLVAMANQTSVPSQSSHDPYAKAINDFADKENFPVSASASAEMVDKSKSPDYDAANPTVKSVDEGKENPLANITQRTDSGDKTEDAATPNANDVQTSNNTGNRTANRSASRS